MHLLFTGAINPAVAGYFASRNSYATAVIPGSNAHDMLIFHTNTLLMPAADLESLLAHEFQHMIRYHIDPDEAAWMNEGFSLLTEQRLGYRGPLRQAEAFLAAPQTSLTVWDGSQRDYGAAFLWLLYFQERYGADALRDLSDQPQTGLQAAEALLGRDNLLYFLADQVLASRLQKPGTPYGYRTASLSPAESTTLELPATRQAELVPYGTHYYHLSNPPPQMTLSFSQPDSLPLIDISAEATDTPDSFWYSQRGDMQNPRLTHALDLRDITASQVQFRVWYALESHWDYAYLSISRDGGRTWQIQDTALTTSQNPGGNAYGSGYTGRSGGWRTDTLSLNNMAGEQIQLRLEVVTDEAVHEAGFALSDAVWLRDDGTSQPLTNWYAEGFVHTANQTALQTWLQVARTDSTGSVSVSRWLVAGDGRYTLPPLPDVVTADISITPLADLSTVPVSYTLRLTR